MPIGLRCERRVDGRQQPGLVLGEATEGIRHRRSKIRLGVAQVREQSPQSLDNAAPDRAYRRKLLLNRFL